MRGLEIWLRASEIKGCPWCSHHWCVWLVCPVALSFLENFLLIYHPFIHPSIHPLFIHPTIPHPSIHLFTPLTSLTHLLTSHNAPLIHSRSYARERRHISTKSIKRSWCRYDDEARWGHKVTWSVQGLQWGAVLEGLAAPSPRL